MFSLTHLGQTEMKFILLATFILFIPIAEAANTANLKWPYPLNIDYQEEFLTEGSLLDTIAHDCGPRDDTTIPAQWIRTVGFMSLCIASI